MTAERVRSPDVVTLDICGCVSSRRGKAGAAVECVSNTRRLMAFRISQVPADRPRGPQKSDRLHEGTTPSYRTSCEVRPCRWRSSSGLVHALSNAPAGQLSDPWRPGFTDTNAAARDAIEGEGHYATGSRMPRTKGMPVRVKQHQAPPFHISNCPPDSLPLARTGVHCLQRIGAKQEGALCDSVDPARPAA